jgi:Flp pilus assembly protein TadG
MRRHLHQIKDERGGTLLEFTFVSSVFFMMLVAIVAISNLYFTHNALVEATRRGARYAATQPADTQCGRLTTGSSNCSACLTRIRNYAIYGNSAGTGTNLLNLQPSNVTVEYLQTDPNDSNTGFGVGSGAVSVSITGFSYNFVVPGISRVVPMPTYRTTVAGESAGVLPDGTCATN